MLKRLLEQLGFGASRPAGTYVIGRTEDLAKHHRDAIADDDPRAGLFAFHDLREREKSGWQAADPARDLASGAPAVLDELTAGLERLDGAYDDDELARTDFDGLQPADDDEAVAELCASYRAATDLGRSFIRSRINEKRAWTLLTFGKRSAVRAVRESRPDLIEHALTALAIENLAAGDVRDDYVALGLIFHCGRRIGADPASLFRKVAATAGPAIAMLLTGFAQRDDLEGILAAMGWTEEESSQGVVYRWRF